MTLRSLLIAGVLALAIASGVQGASAAPQRRVVVVVDASAAQDPAVLADARAAVARAGDEAQLRIPRTPTEQLAVTHYFAAQGYTLVVGVGLDHPVAISPVAGKYPNTRFVTAQPGQAVAALR
jgi:basic membrane lipoprotein Med (substrate-binding protein (PBP1-ABC) superfamily)